MNWHTRCLVILNKFSPTKSQRKFVEGVLDQMDRGYHVPTDGQEVILTNIWRHCVRKYAEDAKMAQVEAEELV